MNGVAKMKMLTDHSVETLGQQREVWGQTDQPRDGKVLPGGGSQEEFSDLGCVQIKRGDGG